MLQTTNIIPILLGSDINVYGMARSFYEAYGRQSIAYASVQFAPTKYSKIVDVKTIDGFNKDPIFIETMTKLAQHYASRKQKPILIACSDGYAELLGRHKDFLAKTFIVPYANDE